MNVRLILPSLLLLAACGSDDPVTDSEKAASGPTVNAAVQAAEQEMEQAQNRAERVAEAEAGGEAADNYAIPSPMEE